MNNSTSVLQSAPRISMKRRRHSLAMATMIATFISVSAWAQVLLVEDGKAHAVVVTADAPTETAQYAARELVWHVEQATGVQLERVAESSAPSAPHTRVYIGDTDTARRNGIDPEQLPREAYLLRSVGNDLFIVGQEDDGDPLREENPHVGTLFGVYEFLESVLGVRWLWPGELGTYIPKTNTITLWSINELGAPCLRFRGLYWGRMRAIAEDRAALELEDARFGFDPDVAKQYADALRVLLRRNRMGGMDIKPPTGHTFAGWWHEYGEEHPEWFMMRRDGERGRLDPDERHVDICVTNEELQNFILSQWDGGPILRLGAVDRPGRCYCDECRAWDGPQPEEIPWFARRVYETDRRAQEAFAGATSDRYARFWKTMQEKAEQRNPDVMISASFLFESEFPAPTTDIQLNNRIYAEYVQWQDPHLRYFPVPDEAFDWLKEQWLGWRRAGIRMGYRPNYLHDGYVLPHFETRQSGEFFKFAAEHGMEGAVFDSLTGQWATQGLRLYMHLRLMAKPHLDIDDIRNEYFAAFGPAADAMGRYFDYWEDYAFEHLLRIIEVFWERGWRYSMYARYAHEAFPLESFAPAEPMLEEAREITAIADAPEYEARVRFIQTGFEHARMAVRMAALFDEAGEVPEDRMTKAKDAFRNLVDFRKAHQHLFFSDLQWVTNFWERPRWNVEPLLDALE